MGRSKFGPLLLVAIAMTSTTNTAWVAKTTTTARTATLTTAAAEYRRTTTAAFPCALALSFGIRRATSGDVLAARKILFREKMNPLFISEQTMLAAYEGDEASEASAADLRGTGKMIGFGQIRQLTGGGSGNGGGDEYGGISDDKKRFSELASLYVLPEYRNKGVGGSIIEELLRRHDDQEKQQGSSKSIVCLLTLAPTVPFYERYGFRVLSEKIDRDNGGIRESTTEYFFAVAERGDATKPVLQLQQLPASIQIEYKAGSILSWFLQNDLVCMARPVA